MNDNCLDIGTIQAFMDGELPHEAVLRVSGHIALCDACAISLAMAEDESAVVFPALAREFDTLVPTKRLWNKINDSIEIERESRPFWQKIYATVVAALASPSFAAAASLLIVFGIFATFWMNKTTVPMADIASGSRSQPTTAVVDPRQPRAADSVANTDEPDAPPVSEYHVERASFKVEPRRIAPAVATNASYTSAGYLPGEQSYVKTISTLAKSVDEQKESGVMGASERISYERDMAVVDDSIKKMKQEVRRNPRNDAAKQVLYASYQNKIDLLNSVSQKEEFLVSLR